MKQSVSARSIFPIASVFSMSIVSVFFVLPGTGVVSGGLGLLTVAAALWVGLWAARSLVPVPAKSVL